MKKNIISFLILLSLFFSFTKISFAQENTFSKQDNKLVDIFYTRAKNIIEIKGDAYKDLIVMTLEEKVKSAQENPRKEVVFNTLIEKIKTIGNDNYLKEYKIDIEKLKQAWISWENEERISLGKNLYEYDEMLNSTVKEWSEISKEKWYIDHKRSVGDSYYNYAKISDWFEQRGVICSNINKITFSESIGWWVFSCDEDDCTDEAINGLKSTFNFFMSEKWKSYAPHYEAIINPYFQYIGFGMSIEKLGTKFKYYTTIHYCTQIIGES